MNWMDRVARLVEICATEDLGEIQVPRNIAESAALALDPRLTWAVIRAWWPLALELQAQWVLGKFPPESVLRALAECVGLVPASDAIIDHFLAQQTDDTLFSQSVMENHAYEMLVSIWRLLNHDRMRYATSIPPRALYDLSSSSDARVRGLAVQCLAQILEASERQTVGWLMEKIGDTRAVSEVRLISFNEAQRLAIARCEIPHHDSSVVDTIPAHGWSNLVTEIGGRLVPRTSTEISSISSCSATYQVTHPVVKTSTSIANIRTLAEAFLTGRPLLLQGEPGAGKTFFVEWMHDRLCPRSDLVRIHLGDQTDAKALVGTYSTGETPGTFEWHPGILTTAVTRGQWVLVEDVDRAPTDILSILLPLLEKRQLVIASRNQVLTAHSSFRLLATTTAIGGADVICQRAWLAVHIQPPTVKDLHEILRSRFEEASPLADSLVAAYESVRSVHALRGGRPLASRDLFKLCARIHTSQKLDDVFRDAVSCFSGFLSTTKLITSVAELLAEHLGVNVSKVATLLYRHRPEIDDTYNDAHGAPTVRIGRALLPVRVVAATEKRRLAAERASFALTSHSLRLLEEIAVATAHKEPLLLVGETGTGKTTLVQCLASLCHRKLVVVNVSQQMELGDLVGGYKPVDVRQAAQPLLDEFWDLFDATFSRAKNQQFVATLNKAVQKGRWPHVVRLWHEAHRMASSLYSPTSGETKRRRVGGDQESWVRFSGKADTFASRIRDLQRSLTFQFVEGLLVRAVRQGHWLLLDEINLAPADTLESLGDLLGSSPTLTLQEKAEVIHAHPDFRLFSCMNPATDVGKRDLPPAVRSRFTELFVPGPDADMEDLRSIVGTYLRGLALADTSTVINDVAELYVTARELAQSNSLADGSGQRPHFSVRTLSRALVATKAIAAEFGLRRALYESFCMCFLTVLDGPSAERMHATIMKHIMGPVKNVKSLLNVVPPSPGPEYIRIGHWWLRCGDLEPAQDPSYIVTESVQHNLLNVVRAAALNMFPVLIQGPTSSGKTSLIRYLAQRTGHQFVRINNHEHTDLQEYLGTYVADNTGVLRFQEGVLVTALREGHWLVLDELNLAPTDVLEALNRLLDDNRELVVPETQEVVKPHPHFMLFATQNPPGVYAGRKVLSRAFRNRFLELHFGDLPEQELEAILRDRMQIAPSYARKIVDVGRALAERRAAGRVFEHKHSFATLRDLFRWAGRPAISYEELARAGMMLLAERVRSMAERSIVSDVIGRVMRVQPLDINYDMFAPEEVMAECPDIVWTYGMKRVLVLVMEALRQNEPVLLVGETGCGKTTICQVLAHVWKKRLRVVNAHQNTETGDIIGAHRPVRKGMVTAELHANLLKKLNADDSETLQNLLELYKATPDVHDGVIDAQIAQATALFEWNDGALVEAMKDGSLFLLDEISLADDSVLERLNSVLEPERSLLLPEKGGADIAITASHGFQFLATMNPGGDYGKKELSPALRNRFTEIWVPSMDSMADVELVVHSRLSLDLRQFSKVITEYVEWYGTSYALVGDMTSGAVSLRDVLAWVQFANATSERLGPRTAIFQGACMVFVDALGSNALSHLAHDPKELAEHRQRSRNKLGEFLAPYEGSSTASDNSHELKSLSTTEDSSVVLTQTFLQIGAFHLSRKPDTQHVPFSLEAPTTARNAMRVLRAMQLPKPILLEGSPGVGKTALISALAGVSGNPLTRINLSDQTDLVDLFGADVPAESGRAGEFVWRDAPFLRAMQRGEWVLLDEMNLAPQAVLEGLNACLDHRGEAYVPELNRTFQKHPKFRVFAAQNPQAQGGGRKGLPKSFVNRFSVVYVDTMGFDDLDVITAHLFPTVDAEIRHRLVHFVADLAKVSATAKGGPFEFNLRDTMRWFELIQAYPGEHVGRFFELVAGQRLRDEFDHRRALELFSSRFPSWENSLDSRDPTASAINAGSLEVNISSTQVRIGFAAFERQSSHQPRFDLRPLHCNIPLLETGIACVTHKWPLLLVGPAGSGKTQLVRQLAVLAGAQLREFAMTADVDSTDLLGEFDQVERSQQLARVWTAVDEYIGSVQDPLAPLVELADATRARDLKAVRSLLKSMATKADTGAIVTAIDTYLTTDFSQPAFRWFDGMLVQAVQHGHWLVLDNANLCSSAVLDRLNSLLEPGGCLLVNECAEASGEPRLIVPHPNFRLFLIVDPRYGELSRAMRNRSVEVYVDELEIRAHVEDKRVLAGSRVSATLGVGSTDALPLARLADALSDTNCAHWLLPTLIGSSDMLQVARFDQNALEVRELRAFLAILAEYTPTNLEMLRALWKVWRLKLILEDVQVDRNVPESELSLLQLSLLSRTKPSIACADALGFARSLVGEAAQNPQLADVLADFVAYASTPGFDPSRVPIWRELSRQASETGDANVGACKNVMRALPLLGRDYDFARGGAGIDRLWKSYGGHGFATEAAAHGYAELVSIATEFDELAKRVPMSELEIVYQIRHGLCEALVAAQKAPQDPLIKLLADPLARVRQAADMSPTDNVGIFAPEFKRLAMLLAVKRVANPDKEPNESLLQAAHFAGVATERLAELWPTPNLRLPLAVRVDNAADVVLAMLERAQTISAIQWDGAAHELRAACDLILNTSRALTPHVGYSMASILRKFTAQVSVAVPEATGDMDEIIRTLGAVDLGGAAAWIEFGHVLMSLYLCPAVYDPAIRQHVLYERFCRRQSEYSSDISWWQQARSVLLGDAVTSTDRKLNQWLAELAHEPVPTVWRPQISRITSLYADLGRWRGILERDHVHALHGESRELWSRSLDMLVERLRSYTGYRDLTSVMITASHALRFGVELRDATSSRGEELWLLDASILASPLRLRAKYLTSKPRALRQVLQSFALHPTAAQQQMLPWLDVMGALYNDWVAHEARRSEQASRDAATFRIAGDEDEKTALQELFGKYDPEEDEHTGPDQASPMDASDEIDTAADVVEAFMAIAGVAEPPTLGSVVLKAAHALRGSTSSAASSSIPTLASIAGLDSGCHLPALYIALRHQADPVQADVVNFYKEPHIGEARAAIALARDVLEGVKPLKERWPDHATLETAVGLAKDLQTLPMSSPLAAYLAKVERLHGVLDEWQRYAPKDASLATVEGSIVATIVRWRRLELATWPRLFDFENRAAERADAAGLFWHLWQVLVDVPESDSSAIARSLILFVSEATHGQYMQRMRLLHAFKAVVADSVVKQVITNVLAYFDPYTEQVETAASNHTAQLRKEVSEVVLLASWRDVNIHALRQSAQRSHRALLKLVRRHREFVGSKVTPLVSGPPKNPLKALTSIPPAMNLVDTSKHEQFVADLTEWAARPPPLRNLILTQQKMAASVDELFSEETLTPTLMELARDIIASAAALRRETPRELTEETKRLAGALKSQKAALLTQTLRTLRAAGLRPSIRQDVVEAQAQLSRVLADAPALTEGPFSAVNPSFFRLVELLPRLRAAVSESESDCPAGDLRRGLVFAENALWRLARSRRVAGSVDRALGVLNSIENDLRYVATGALAQGSNRSLEPQGSELNSWSKHMSLFLRDIDPSLILEVADMPVDVTSSWWWSSAAAQWLKTHQEYLTKLAERFEESPAGPEALVAPLFADTPGSDDLQMTSGVSHMAIDTPDSSGLSISSKAASLVAEVSAQILVRFQNVKAANETKDDAWFVASHRRLDRMLNQLRLPAITESLSRALEACMAGNDTAAAWAGLLLPFAVGYRTLAFAVAQQHAQLQAATAEGAVELGTLLHSLATEGFCSPVEPSDQPEQGDSKAGMGLGDGEGAQATAKDTEEDDDDLAEAAQSSNPDQGERDEAQDDNAKEIEGDMAGELEDAPPEPSDAEDQQDEQSDLDEEVGDADGEDAVDEKMWNDEAEDDKRDAEKRADAVDGEQGSDAEAAPDTGPEGSEETKDLEDKEASGSEASDGESEDDEVPDETRDAGKEDPDDANDAEQKGALDLPDDMDLSDPGTGESELDNDMDMEDDEQGPDDALDLPQTDTEPKNESDKEGDAEDEPESQDVAEEQDNVERDDNAADQENQEAQEGQKDADMDAEDAEKSEESPEETPKQEEGEDSKPNRADEAETAPEEEQDAAMEVDGLHGPDDDGEVNAQQSTASDRPSGTEGQGHNADASAEQESVEAGGTATAAPTDQQPPPSENQPNEMHESLRQLGDAMKEFHRRQREIHDRSEEPQDTREALEDAPVDEVEHVGEEDHWDTQALGRSTERQDVAMDAESGSEAEPEDAQEEQHMHPLAAPEKHEGAGGDQDQQNDDAGTPESPSVEVPSGAPRPEEPEPEESESSDDEYSGEVINEQEPSGEKDAAQARELWRIYDTKTHDLTLILCEQLRLILEPTLATKLRGDYKTGKRLNMKRIIPYIASDFKKDRIWLRRTKPAKRQYQVMLAVDDSRSMSEPRVADLAYQSIAVVAKALAHVEAGQLAVASFGADCRVVHELGQPWTVEAAAKTLQQFQFDKPRTNVLRLLERSLELFEDARARGGPIDKWQLEIIVSDGVCEDHGSVRRLVRKAHDQHVMVVFVVLDALNKDASILDMNQVSYSIDASGAPSLDVQRYMDDFPFEYYVIVRDISSLPGVLASVLRQYFQAVDTS